MCPLPGTLLPCEHGAPALVDWSFIILKLLWPGPAPSPPQLEQGTAGSKFMARASMKCCSYTLLVLVTTARGGTSTTEEARAFYFLLLCNIHDTYYISNADISVYDGVRQKV